MIGRRPHTLHTAFLKYFWNDHDMIGLQPHTLYMEVQNNFFKDSLSQIVLFYHEMIGRRPQTLHTAFLKYF